MRCDDSIYELDKSNQPISNCKLALHARIDPISFLTNTNCIRNDRSLAMSDPQKAHRIP